MENKKEETITEDMITEETSVENNGLSLKSNDKVKDTLFRTLFSDKKKLLSLYNALNGSNYEDENLIRINTLEQVIFMRWKNDVSFIIKDSLNLYEHQSTPNPNMPLRCFYYINDLYHKETYQEDLYSSRMFNIPTPQFIVLYNGTDTQEEKFEYKLSDMFTNKTENPALELKVMVYNINKGMNEDVKNACEALKGYMICVDKIRDKVNQGMSSTDAVIQSINECIEEDVLRDFFLEHKEIAMNACLYEYDEQKHIKNEKNISFEEGLAEGEERKQYDIVLRMLEKNVPLKNIADYLDVSIDYIKQIEAELLAKA